MFGAYRIPVILTIVVLGSIFAINIEFADATELCFAPTCTTGNFYIADSGSGSPSVTAGVYEFDSAGGAPLDTDFAAGVSHHKTLAFDSAGNLYVGFGGSNNVVIKYDSAGNVLDSNFAATIPTLGAIAIDSADNLYVQYTATAHASIMKFDSTGTEVLPRFIPGGTVGNILDMTFDSADNLYVVDANAASIRKFDISTTPATEILPTFITGLTTPQSLAIDSAGRVYVATSGTVRQYDSAGTIIEADFVTSLSFARAIAFDSDDNLYIADSGNNRLEKYDTSVPLGDPGVLISNDYVGTLGNPRAMAFATMQNPVGSTSIPIDSASLLVAGSQMDSIWITLSIIVAVGIGAVIVTKKFKN